MSPEAQRIALAGVRGYVTGASLGYNAEQAYEFYRPDPNGAWHDIATWTKKYDWVQNFDPLNDLNAVHEAEKVLTDDDAEFGSRRRFITELIEITGAKSMEMHPEVFVVAHATASQRSESLLRCLGLWVE